MVICSAPANCVVSWDDAPQKPRLVNTLTVSTEPPIPAQMMWRMPRCQMSRASASTSSNIAASASSRATPSTQSSFNSPFSLPSVAISPSRRRSCPTASSAIMRCNAGDILELLVILCLSFQGDHKGAPVQYANKATGYIRVLYGRTLAVALVSLCSVQHLPRVRHQQNALFFSVCPILRVDLAIIIIAEIDAQAAFFRDACCQRNANTRRF